jgi:hypothetical protein
VRSSGVDSKHDIKLTQKEHGGKVRIGRTGRGQGPAAGCCECGDEHSVLYRAVPLFPAHAHSFCV